MTPAPYCVHSLAVKTYRVGTQLLCGSCAEALMESEFPYPIVKVALTGNCEDDCQERCAHPGQFTECEFEVAT
jgi:hypothetical protein